MLFKLLTTRLFKKKTRERYFFKDALVLVFNVLGKVELLPHMLVIRVIYARWRSLIMQRTGVAAIEQSENL